MNAGQPPTDWQPHDDYEQGGMALTALSLVFLLGLVAYLSYSFVLAYFA